MAPATLTAAATTDGSVWGASRTAWPTRAAGGGGASTVNGLGSKTVVTEVGAARGAFTIATVDEGE